MSRIKLFNEDLPSRSLPPSFTSVFRRIHAVGRFANMLASRPAVTRLLGLAAFTIGLAPVSGFGYDISGVVKDSAGVAVASAKVWLQSDSTKSTTTDANGHFHLVATVVGLRPVGATVARGLALRVGGSGTLFLDAPSAMNLSLTVSDLRGRQVRARESVAVSGGGNRLESLVGFLPAGSYVLTAQGKGVSLSARLVSGPIPFAEQGNRDVTEPAVTAPGRLLAKTSASAAALMDLNGKVGLVCGKDGFAPALYVPRKETDTGITVTLKKPISKPDHIIVIYLENWSFDGLYGKFAGAEGLEQAYSALPQTDSNHTAYAYLPQPWNTDTNVKDSLYPDTLANRPFSFLRFLHLNNPVKDMVHRFYQEQLQIDGGKMDQYAAVSNARGAVMGYFDTDSLPLVAYAKQYTLCDHFYHSAFGGSFLNHMWLIAARTPMWADIPTKYRATLDSATGFAKKTADRTYADGAATPEGYLINTQYTHNNPHPATAAAEGLVPDLDFPTIGDRMNDKGVTWAWYSGGWDSATAGHPDSAFQFHHQSFAFFKNYADGTPGKAAHLKDEKDFIAALNAGTLPQVSFIKPVGVNNEHPGYTDVKSGELHTAALIEAVKASSIWSNTVIVITYDENGGLYDHVAPPVIDRWGPGTRVPTLVISPLAKTNYVDKHQLETVSILSLIERRFGLIPLSSRDAEAGDLTTSLMLP